MQGYDADVLKQRAQHDGGVVWDKIKAGMRTINRCLRGGADARLMAGLTPDQQGAFERIEAAHRMLTVGVGMQTFDPNRVRGSGSGDVERGAILQVDYMAWYARCTKARLSPALALDTISFGWSLRHMDKERRKPRGYARDNLVACLNQWR